MIKFDKEERLNFERTLKKMNEISHAETLSKGNLKEIKQAIDNMVDINAKDKV